MPIVILTARDGELDELKGFNCGADEYIAKPFSPNILMARIKSLLKRCELLMEETVTIDDFVIDSRQRTVHVGDKRIILTPKEFDLIYYLVNNKNLALSREQIPVSYKHLVPVHYTKPLNCCQINKSKKSRSQRLFC